MQKGRCAWKVHNTGYIRSTHHPHHHIYFRLPEKPQKPIELATIKQQKENCTNEKIQKVKKNDFKI